MEAKGKLTKEVVAQEARFILDSVLNSGNYPQEVPFEDLRHQCEASVSLRLLDYVNFLERFGYLTYDRATHLLNITNDGERVVSGEKMAELVIDVVHHFRPILARTRASRGGQQQASRRRGASAAKPRVGRIDERYEKIKPLGSGGIGTVYLARQVPLDREVAFKEVRELFGFFTEPQRQEIVRRFDDESRRAGRLSHPNIAAILDGNTTCEYPYLVSEYVPSGSLRQVLAQAETIPPELSVKVFLQVLHGLGHAHGHDVVHRGLKPENILFDSNGNVRLTDFGMARVVQRDQAVIRHVYVGMGSVAYLAPELFTDPTGADKRTDLYALGILFYEMLARKLPGRRSPMPTKLHPTLPKIIDDMFDRLTQDEPEDRYQSVADVLEDFHKSDQSKNFLEPRGAVLFLSNPLAKLKMREVEEAEGEDEGGGGESEGDEPLADESTSVAEVPARDSPSLADKAGEGDGAGEASALDGLSSGLSGLSGSLSGQSKVSSPSDVSESEVSGQSDVPGISGRETGPFDAPAVGVVSASEASEPEVQGDGDAEDDGQSPRLRRGPSHRPYSFQQRIKERDK